MNARRNFTISKFPLLLLYFLSILSSMIRVAINGYGRIGRVAHRVILERFTDQIEVVAINAGTSSDLKGWAYLLKYDTAYGPLIQNVKSQNSNLKHKDQIGSIIIDGKDIPVFAQNDPSLLPWKHFDVDVVLECTGAFRKEEDLQKHLTSGAKKVVLSAPLKKGDIGTFVLSINQDDYKGERIISNASCTTNCITPVAKIMNEYFGVEKAMMTTIHGYTADQRLQDGGHKDYRRARAAGQNIIPTSTGATTAAAKAYPQLTNRFDGLAIRVPVITGSLSDFTFITKKNVSVEEVNSAFVKEAGNPLYKGILAVTTDPFVSSDIIGNSHSAIVDLSLTQVVLNNMVKIIAWYDNEYGYANRLVEEVLMVGKEGSM